MIGVQGSGKLVFATVMPSRTDAADMWFGGTSTMSLAGSPWSVISQAVLIGAIALKVLTFQQNRVGMALALVSVALTVVNIAFLDSAHR